MFSLFKMEWPGERVENMFRNGLVGIQTHGLKNFSYGKKKKKKDDAG